MRSFVFIVLVAVLMGGCNAERKATVSPVGFVPLENYFVPLNNGLDTGYVYKVITDQTEFERTIKTSNAAAAGKPEFSGQVVVVVIHNTGPNKRTDLVIDGATIGGKQMNVYYHVKGTSSSTSTTYLPGLALGTVPKAQAVKQVSFYQDSVLMKTIPVSIY